MGDGVRVDGRTDRRAKVVPFISKLEHDRKKNLARLKALAESLRDHITNDDWQADVWNIVAPSLLSPAGKNRNSATMAFVGQERIGGEVLRGEFNIIAKALVVLRYHRSSQSLENQRSFITAISYVERYAPGVELFRVTEEHLNSACDAIAKDYSEGAAYNLHKAIGEFAAHLDSNGLSRIPLNFKYAKMRRPDNAGGLTFHRLDDPGALLASSEKMASAEVYQLLGALYQRVPQDHRYRLQVLVLAILAAAGRRFAEISALPLKCLKKQESGEVALLYFPKKYSKGHSFTPYREAWLATDMAHIVVAVVEELTELCAPARETARRMREASGPVMDFLAGVGDDELLGVAELESIGIPVSLLYVGGWLRDNGFAQPDTRFNRKMPGPERWVTNAYGVRKYCERDFNERLISPIHIDQFGTALYLEDMLICQHLYLGGADAIRASWLANSYSHVMLHKFIIRILPQLAKEFAPEIEVSIDFSSHAFRHTINTLLDEGGLPELLQTDWFGRKNP